LGAEAYLVKGETEGGWLGSASGKWIWGKTTATCGSYGSSVSNRPGVKMGETADFCKRAGAESSHSKARRFQFLLGGDSPYSRDIKGTEKSGGERSWSENKGALAGAPKTGQVLTKGPSPSDKNGDSRGRSGAGETVGAGGGGGGKERGKQLQKKRARSGAPRKAKHGDPGQSRGKKDSHAALSEAVGRNNYRGSLCLRLPTRTSGP